MIVRFKKLDPRAQIPEYKTEGASGFDFAALEDTKIEAGETHIVRTGLAVELPKRVGPVLYEMQVRPRSGLALNTPLRIANTPGTVDIDYRGEIGIIMTNTDPYCPFQIKAGDRIAQGVVCPVVQCEIVEEIGTLTETERGEGGYGSTGVN